MTTNTKTIRITKTMKFDALRAALNGEPLPHDLTTADLLAYIDAEQALLVKKNTAEHKPTKTQMENEGYKVLIQEFLALQADGVTCTDIQKGVPEFADFQNQKIAALLRPLVQSGVVTKTIVKGRAVFALA